MPWAFAYSSISRLRLASIFAEMGKSRTDEEAVAERDLRSTRKFLDWRGVLAAKEFDAFVQAATPA